MESAEGVLAAREVSKSFGSFRALRSISLSFSIKEVVLLLGANGAGKSTLLRVLAGLSRPDAGAVARGDRVRVGFASHHHFLYARLTVRENLTLYSHLAGDNALTAREAIDRWGLGGVADKAVAELSKGNQARASLARALMGDPEALLLDEPSSNLDEQGTDLLKTAIREQGARGLAIVATHDIHRMRDVATRVVSVARGEIVADSGSGASADRIDSVIARYRESNR